MSEERKIENLLKRGGTDRVDLLRYSVISVTLEPLVLFLVSEYRLRPGVVVALAIYDAFCAQTAPARIDAAELMPARDVRLASVVASLRAQAAAFARALDAVQSANADSDEAIPPAPVPPMADPYLFDPLVSTLWAEPEGALLRLEREYDAALTPEQNLPGERCSPSQLNFVSQVWRPRVRPLLVEAGFWQLSSID